MREQKVSFKDSGINNASFMRFDFQCDIPNISILNFVDKNKTNVICTHNLNTCYNVKQLQCLTVNILQKKLTSFFFFFFTKVDFIIQS